MARIVFTANIQRHVACPETEAAGSQRPRGPRQRVCRQSAGAFLRARRPGGAAPAHDDLRRRRGHSRSRAAHRSGRLRPARSMSSRHCREVDHERRACWSPPARGCSRLARRHGSWGIEGVDFLGDNVTLTLTDPRSGRHYAALDHGHFGVKVHRSTATGWEEIAAPAYPPKPEGLEENDMWGRPLAWSTARIWALQAGGTDEPGVIWCGTLPGGLFRSTDHGDSWEMIRSLWDHPKRRQWMGGGADLPGIHSIVRRPAQFEADVDRGVDRRRLVHRGCRRKLGAARRRHARRARAAGTDARPDRPGRALPGAMSRRARSACGCSTTTASSSRPTRAATFSEISGVEPSSFRLRGRGASARAGHRLVRPGDQGREAHSPRRHGWSSPAPATAAGASTC